MAEAKRDEVPLPEPTFRAINGLHGTDKPPAWLIWDRPVPVPVFAHFPVIDFYTADQLREHGRQCVQAAVPVMPQEVTEVVRVLMNLRPRDDVNAGYMEPLLAWLRSQNLIKE